MHAIGAALLAWLALGLSAGAWASAFASHPLPGVDGTPLQAIVRGPLTPPERFRVVVVPGSGCAGMGTVAERYFAGLLHARVLVLHKRTVAADATTAPADCGADFVRHDALAPWLADAQAALAAWQRELASPPLPLVLVGISEGAELLPALAARLHPAALVLVGSSGLDPVQAGRLQAERLGERAAWDELARAQACAADDVSVVQGRSLRYWRDFWHWPVQVPLLAGPWPLLQIWGEDDALVPQAAYRRFEALAQGRAALYCAVRLPGADHGLQAPGHDGVQWLWARLERWARAPERGWCSVFTESP